MESGDFMFVSEYYHTIDSKGRIIIPAKIREELLENFVVNKGLDGCLNIYTASRWDDIYANLLKIPQTKKEVRKYIRVMTSNAIICNVDNQGRVVISAQLIKAANLEKECVVVGAGDHVEIWAKDKWIEYIDEANDCFEDISEAITEYMV